MPLNQKSLEFLISLEAARLEAEEFSNPGVAWREVPPGQNPGQILRAGLVEKRGRLYRITDKGRRLLAEDDPQEPENKIIPMESDSAPVVAPPPDPVPKICISDCQNCVYREALDILSRRLPEAGNLTDLLKRLDRFNQ